MAIELVGLSVFAQLSAAPIVAAAYNQISVLGSPANLAVVPALFVLIPAGFIAALVGCAWPAAAAALFHGIVAPVLHFIVATVVFFAGLPRASIAEPDLPTWAIVAYYVVLIGGGAMLRIVHPRDDEPSTVSSEPSEPAAEDPGALAEHI